MPITVWLILNDRMATAFWLFALAGVSDALDGFLAKQFNARSAIGGLLDPLADKALLVSVFITLGHQGYVATWLVILVVFRDALIVLAVLVANLLDIPLKIQPLFISKLNTASQILLAAAVLARAGLGPELWGVVETLVVVVAVTTFASGSVYVVHWGRVVTEIEGGPG